MNLRERMEMHLRYIQILRIRPFLGVFFLCLILMLATGAWVRLDVEKAISAIDQPPIPGLKGTIIDDVSGQFSIRGPVKYWHEENQGYGAHFWWTKNNLSGIENVAQWHLEITEPGLYELFTYIPTLHSTTNAANYSIYHNGVVDSIKVNQSAHQNSWYKLGDFLMAGSGEEYIQLVDETGEAESEFEIAFDAVGFSFVEPDWEEKITGALWERIRPWLDEKTSGFQELFKEWLNDQKGKLLQKLADSLKNWIDQQCASLSAAALLPIFAVVIWLRQRRKPPSSD